MQMDMQGSAGFAREGVAETTEVSAPLTYVTEGNWNWLVKECGTGELLATCATQTEARAKSREIEREMRASA